MIKGATISVCGTYRYRLWRGWDTSKDLVGFIMLNPSTADADKDDATIRRCIGFAKSWDCGGIMVTNLFALRTKSPKVLEAFRGSRTGPDNAEHVRTEAKEGVAFTVAAWGNHGRIVGMGDWCRKMLIDEGVTLYHLGLTKSGQPRHPVRLSKRLQPRLWL